jgi:TRAP-type mannitol/chloroaromatic compound transport system substrate-binding protein
VFESLSPAHQKIIEIAAAEAHAWNLTQFLSNNGAALQRLQAGGVTVREFPDSVWDAMGAASQAVLDENMGDELLKKIYDSMRTSMKSSSGWIDRSINAYAAQRDRVLG